MQIGKEKAKGIIDKMNISSIGVEGDKLAAEAREKYGLELDFDEGEGWCQFAVPKDKVDSAREFAKKLLEQNVFSEIAEDKVDPCDGFDIITVNSPYIKVPINYRRRVEAEAK